MGTRSRLAWVAAVTVLAAGVWAAPAGAFVYWTNQGAGSIGRANLDGTAPNESFIAGLGGPAGIAVDGQYIYWSERGTGTIGRANLDGSGVNDAFIRGVNGPLGVAVDGQHIYWADQVDLTIGRANLDGTGANGSFITGVGAFGLAVDSRHIYWGNLGLGIGRANLDGSGATNSFITTADQATGVAVDGRHVYWDNAGATNTIGRANLDGTGAVQDLVTGQSLLFGLAVDSGHVYWTDVGNRTVGRANLDGTGVIPSFATTDDTPAGVAVDGGPAGHASASATGMAFATQPLGTWGAPRSLTITNTGHGNLEIGTAGVAGRDADDFLVGADTCSHATLTIGATCTIHVRFGPSASGNRQATLALASNDTASPLRIALTGSAGALPQGPSGRTGPQGPAGARGPRGAPGQVRLVTCRTVKVKVGGHRVNRRRCKTRLITGTATFRLPARARASLTRRHVLYATGRAQHGRLVLDARRRLPSGRYTLTLRHRRHGHPTVARRPITIR